MMIVLRVGRVINLIGSRSTRILKPYQKPERKAFLEVDLCVHDFMAGPIACKVAIIMQQNSDCMQKGDSDVRDIRSSILFCFTAYLILNVSSHDPSS